MAKKKKNESKADTSKTSANKKMIVILIVIILILAVALLGYFKVGIINEAVTGFFTESELNSNSETIQVQEIEEEMPIAKEMLKLTKDNSPKKQLKKRHYLKVATCVFSDCQTKYQRILKGMKLPIRKRLAYKKTMYYELLSEDEFSLRRAKEKIKILNKYNKQVTFPTLVKSRKNNYKISYGQFPNKRTSISFKSNLAQLYPKVIIGFEIKTRYDKYKITNIYTGPFSKASAQKIKLRLKDNPDFPLIEITAKI